MSFQCPGFLILSLLLCFRWEPFVPLAGVCAAFLGNMRLVFGNSAVHSAYTEFTEFMLMLSRWATECCEYSTSLGSIASKVTDRRNLELCTLGPRIEGHRPLGHPPTCLLRLQTDGRKHTSEWRRVSRTVTESSARHSAANSHHYGDPFYFWSASKAPTVVQEPKWIQVLHDSWHVAILPEKRDLRIFWWLNSDIQNYSNNITVLEYDID